MALALSRGETTISRGKVAVDFIYDWSQSSDGHIGAIFQAHGTGCIPLSWSHGLTVYEFCSGGIATPNRFSIPSGPVGYLFSPILTTSHVDLPDKIVSSDEVLNEADMRVANSLNEAKGSARLKSEPI